MDRLIYLTMTGAKYLLTRQDALANNLANANTSGFRAETTAFRAVPVQGVGSPTRAFAVETTPRVDFTGGPIEQTGRDLDVAVNGSGWIAVQGLDGNEAYTRAGNLKVDENGTLMTASGLPVLSDSGPIAVPPDSKVTIAPDGTVTATPVQPPLKTANIVGRIKLVNPPEDTLVRGADGLFRTNDGASANLDENVKLIPGSIEGSNVNVAEAMVGMIAAARQFDLQMKMLSNADQNARTATELLTVNG